LLRRWAEKADVLLAADSGADLLYRLGIRPSHIVGDMDSVSDEARNAAPNLIDDDQNSTDCDKLLHYAGFLGLKRITLLGVEGDRLDHVLGSLGSACRSPLDVRLALRGGLAFTVTGGRARSVDAAPGRRVSFMPLTSVAGARLGGVRWPLDRADMSALGLVSVSNVAEASTVQASVERGAAVLFVEVPIEEMPVW
jgi:thiamine pyrophosphokinase